MTTIVPGAAWGAGFATGAGAGAVAAAGAAGAATGALAAMAGCDAIFADASPPRFSTNHPAPIAPPITTTAPSSTIAGTCDLRAGAGGGAAVTFSVRCVRSAAADGAGFCDHGGLPRRKRRVEVDHGRLGRARGRRHRRLPDRVQELARGLVTLVGTLGERLADHRIERARHLHVELRRRQRLFLEHLVHDRRERAGERLLAGQQLVEDHARGKEVRPAVDGLAHELLGRHVARGAEHHAGLGEVRGLEPRNAEIGDLRGAVGEDDDVGRLDVAVDHAVLVRVLERLEQLAHDAHDVVHREALVRLEVALQLAPLHELHRDVVRAGVLAEIVDPDDVRVGEPARRLGLAAEARELLLRVLALQVLGADRLERDDPIDHRVVALVHDPHRALAELAADLEFSELREFAHARCRPVRTPGPTCTCCRSPRPISAPAAAPWCRGRRRPAATARSPSRRCRWRRSPFSPPCSPARPARSSPRP